MAILVLRSLHSRLVCLKSPSTARTTVQSWFDENSQAELLEMYRRMGVGKPLVPLALLAMATLVQTYTGTGDQEAV